MLQKRDRIEDALDDPHLARRLHRCQRCRRRPPHPCIALAWRKARLLLAEAMRTINQALPPAALDQRKAHSRSARADLAIVVAVLGVEAFQRRQVKATRELQVGIGRSVGRRSRWLEALGPVVEQVVVQILDVQLAPALGLAAALHHPRLEMVGVKLFLAARRALAAAHVLGTTTVLESVIPFQPGQHLLPQILLHRTSLDAERAPRRERSCGVVDHDVSAAGTAVRVNGSSEQSCFFVLGVRRYALRDIAGRINESRLLCGEPAIGVSHEPTSVLTLWRWNKAAAASVSATRRSSEASEVARPSRISAATGTAPKR